VLVGFKKTELNHTVARHCHKIALLHYCRDNIHFIYSLPSLRIAARGSSSMTSIVMILVCVIVAISILLYLVHWCHQKRNVSQVML
jgi:hypothetical protein